MFCVSSRRILHNDPPIPNWFSPEARDFVLRLLTRDPKLRLGAESDASQVERHAFFSGLRWSDVEKKMQPPPIKPHISHPTDTTNFSNEFTNMPVAYSPAPLPQAQPPSFTQAAHSTQSNQTHSNANNTNATTDQNDQNSAPVPLVDTAQVFRGIYH